jgi:unsaturated chondroitin disaccharide hydrolase
MPDGVLAVPGKKEARLMIPTKLDSPPRPPGLASDVSTALGTVSQNIATFGDQYPDDTTIADVYPVRAAKGPFPEGSNFGWTTSFWPGMQWLAYELTGDDVFRRAGERHVQSFADRVERGIDVDTHDLGFLYTLACVAPWRLTGNVQARQAALAAADLLMARFLEPAGIIQAWGDLSEPAQRGRTIIDSLMNTPLLYWASEQTGDPRFRNAAHRHTIALRDHIIRPDNTTFHTFFWDTETGEPLRGATHQGHSDSSCWARGQAWGIYGFALNFRYTADETLLRAAQRCADYFLDHLPADRVAYWDLAFGDGSGQERDSSAAASRSGHPRRPERPLRRRRRPRIQRPALARRLSPTRVHRGRRRQPVGRLLLPRGPDPCDQARLGPVLVNHRER